MPEDERCEMSDQLSLAGKALSEAGASKGGKERARRLSPEARSAIAKRASSTRWAKSKLISPETPEVPENL
jgi:hypothetical protein